MICVHETQKNCDRVCVFMEKVGFMEDSGSTVQTWTSVSEIQLWISVFAKTRMTCGKEEQSV